MLTNKALEYISLVSLGPNLGIYEVKRLEKARRELRELVCLISTKNSLARSDFFVFYRFVCFFGSQRVLAKSLTKKSCGLDFARFSQLSLSGTYNIKLASRMLDVHSEIASFFPKVRPLFLAISLVEVAAITVRCSQHRTCDVVSCLDCFAALKENLLVVAMIYK